MKISALKAVPLSSLMSGLSARNAMLSAALAKIVPHSVYHAIHHPN